MIIRKLFQFFKFHNMKKLLNWCKTPLGKIVCVILVAILLAPIALVLTNVISLQQFLNTMVVYIIALGLAIISPLYIAAVVMAAVYFAQLCIVVWDAGNWLCKAIYNRFLKK